MAPPDQQPGFNPWYPRKELDNKAMGEGNWYGHSKTSSGEIPKRRG